MTTEIIYDIEVYPGRFCVGFKVVGGKFFVCDTITEINKLPWDDRNYLLIGFNNRRYDQPIIDAARAGASYTELFNMSRDIIVGRADKFSFSKTIVDLYAICPKIAKCSLKEFGHRLRYPTLENLLYPYDEPLTDEQWGHVKRYCEHDVNITEMLWHKLKPEHLTRQNLKKSFDIPTEYAGAPKLAENAILSKLPPTCALADPTDCGFLIKQNNLILSESSRAMYDAAFDFEVSEYLLNNKPDFMNQTHNINGCEMQFGVGGLHGLAKPGVYSGVCDYDVVSYYPSIILNCELGSDVFRDIYRRIYDERLALKEKGEQRADSLKLILNSIFGKMADLTYTNVRIQAPHLALTICLLGQFYLIDLIEKLKPNICLVANTDGIFTTEVIPDKILNEWCDRTGFDLDYNHYKTFILKDVNAYYAVPGKIGKMKSKKEFLAPDWTHNTKAAIIAKLAIGHILCTSTFDETIAESTMWDYLFFTKTTGGRILLIDGEPIPNPKVRWYASLNGSTLQRQRVDGVNSSIVADSLITLAMTVKNENTLPVNLNMPWYIAQAKKLITSVGVSI